MSPNRAARNLVTGMVVAVSLTAGAPVLAANATRGGELARQWCAGCHVVAANQKEANAGAPSFASIARRPSFNAKAVAFFLLDPHPPMPNFSLSRSEANDLAAYIATQK